jgi:PAS domain S-box-containing protein
MSVPSEPTPDWKALRERFLGLGGTAIPRSYYPLLQRRLDELHESQRFLATLMNNLPGMVYRCRPGHVRPLEFVSEGIARLTGFPAESSVGDHALEFAFLLHPDDRERVAEQIRQAVESRNSFSVRYRLKTMNGELRWVLDTGRGVYGRNGEVLAIEGYVTDVTELKRAEEQLAIRTVELKRIKEVDQLKSQFVNAVSHDLRTPLTIMKGFLEFLEEDVGGELTPKQRMYVAELVKSSRRLEHLVDDLLDFARIEAGTFQLKRSPTNLGDLLQGVVDSFRPQAEQAGLSLEVTSSVSPVVVELDRDRIERVLFNFIQNALKFTPAGGRIEVGCRVEGPVIRCEISDTGVGIAREDLPKLFQRFAQLGDAAKRGGTGLGLSINKSIVEAHGGAVGVTSQPGKGCTFWFTLPLEVAHEPEPTAEVRGIP